MALDPGQERGFAEPDIVQPSAVGARLRPVAEDALGARFILGAGVMHVTQPEPALAAVGAAVDAYQSPFAVAALHGLTSLSGSVLLALAVARGAWSAEEAWRAAHVDEDFQILQWGEDDEAMARRAARWTEFEAAARVIGAV